MSDKFDELIGQIKQLTDTVLEHKEDRATLDMDRLVAEVNKIVDQQVDLKIAEAESRRPLRKGEWIGPEWYREQSQGIVQSGKFKGHKVSDILFAGNFLEKARAVDPSGVKPISDEMRKFLSASGSGTGAELVPTGTAELWEDISLASKVANAVGIVPMPTDPFDFPVGWGAVTWRKGAAGTETTGSEPATAKSTLTTTEQIAEIAWSYDLDEDAVLAVLPSLRAELARSAAEQIDAFVLNADGTTGLNSNINLIDGTPASDAYYLSAGQDGIRHYYLVDNTGQSTNIASALDDAKWRAGVGRMGKYGVDPNQVVAITNVKTYLLSILGLSNVRTVDKYGPAATILTGELAKIDGIPIIVSASMPLAMSTGKVSGTPANNTTGQIALVHRPSWKIGFRRQLLIEVDRDIRKRLYYMVVSFRIAVGCRDNGSSRDAGHTAGIHGITY